MFLCAGCAVQRVPIGAGPPFLRAAGLVRVSDLRAVSPPAWSPDGRLLAFSTADAVWSVRPAPGDVDRRRVAPIAGVRRVAWRPDGRTIAALAGGRLLEMGFDDPAPRPLVPADGVQDAAWPPAGRTAFDRTVDAGGPIYATARNGRATLWLAGSGGRTVRVAALPPDFEVRGLTWMSGSVGVAVAAGTRGGASDRVLYVRPGVRAAPRTEMLPAGGRDPIVSPEGRFIAFLQDTPGDQAAGPRAAQVAVMRADGTGRRLLTPPGQYTGLAWSPAGTVLAYAKQQGSRAAIEIADILTGERLWIGDYRPETAASPAPLVIVWAPGGTRLAFGTDTGTTDGFVWIATLERR